MKTLICQCDCSEKKNHTRRICTIIYNSAVNKGTINPLKTMVPIFFELFFNGQSTHHDDYNDTEDQIHLVIVDIV